MKYLYSCSWTDYHYSPKESSYFHCFSAEVIIPEMLWVRPKNSKELTHENGTLRNNTANIIIRWLHV